MARAGMAKWRQGGGGRAPSSLTEGGDEVQRSLELLDRVLSEFDDLENGNVEERGPAAQGPKAQQQAPSAEPAAAPPPAAPPSNNRAEAVGGRAGARGGGGGSTPEDEDEEEEEEERSHQSEDDGYMSMNGRRVAQRPPPPPPREEEVGEEEEEGGMGAETPPPIPPLPAAVAPVVAPRSPPLPPLPPAASAVQTTSNEEEDFPPPPEEAERIISTLLPRVSPSGGSGRARNHARGRLACGWGSLGPPVASYKIDTALDPELAAEGCFVTTSTQTTLPQTRHQRPYGWNVPIQQSNIPISADAKKPRRLPGEGKPPPPLPPLRFGSLPLDSRPNLPATLPPRTLPGAGERHRVVRRRDEGRLLLVTDHQVPLLLNNGEEESSDGGSRKSPAVGGGEAAQEEETFSDDSLEATEAAPRPPPSPSYSASSTSPPGSEDGKRRSVAWEVSLEELDALAEEEGEDAGEEGGGESALGSGEVAGMLPGCTRVVRGRSSRSRRSSSSDRSLASSEPRSVDDRSGSWRGRRSASSVSVGLHLSSNGEEEYSGSGLEGGGEAAAELDDMANADMAILGDVDVPVTSHDVRGGLKGTYVIRKKRGRAGLSKGREEEAKPPRGEEVTVQHLGTPPSETSWTSSPDSDEKRNPKNNGNRTPEKAANRTPKHFYSSRIPVLENSRIPIPESSRILVLDGSKARTPERSSPSKNVVYLSANAPKTPEKTAPEPHQVVVKITESGSTTVVTGDQVVTTTPASRPSELPDLRKTSRPNTPMERTPERRNASGKLPPAPPPRTVTANSPAISKSPLASPSAPEVAGKVSPATPSKVPASPVRLECSAFPEDSRPECDIPTSPVAKVSVESDRDTSKPESELSIIEIGPPEASSTPVPVQNGSRVERKDERALKSPAPLPPVPRKMPAPQPPPRPMPRVLSMPAIALCAELEEAGKEPEWRDSEVEKAAEVKPEVKAEVEVVKKESVDEKGEANGKEVEVNEKKSEEEIKVEEEENRGKEDKEEGVEENKTEERVVVEEVKAIKEVAMCAEEEKKVAEGVNGEEKGERDVREREVETKEQVLAVENGGLALDEEEFGCFLGEPISLLPLQRSSTMPAVEESSPHKIPIAPSASASSFPPLPPSPVDDYSEVYDTTFFMRKLPQIPRIPPPDGPLPPSPPSDSPPPPPPHSMAFHRPREASLKSRSMDGGFPRGQRRATGGSNGRRGEVPGERRTLPTELQCASGRRRRRDEGDRPLSPVPSPPPHAPAHLPPPRPQIPAPPTASLPETPVFSPRKGAPAVDVPRRGHMYARRGESNGEAMRHPSGAMTAGPGSGVCSGYSLCGTVVSSTSSTASSSPFPGGLGPGRGWYPRHRHHPGAPPATSGHHHHLHPAHNRPRPASTEHLDRLAAGPVPTAWDLHGYGPARAVVGGGAGVGGMCGGPVGARKPLTLPPNLTPKFFHRSPREALRRVTSLLIRKGSTSKEAGRRDGAPGASGVTSPTAAGPSSPPAVATTTTAAVPTASASGESPEGTRGKRGFFKSFWKRSRHYSLEHQ